MPLRTFRFVEKSLLVLTLRTELVFQCFRLPLQPPLVSEDFPRVGWFALTVSAWRYLRSSISSWSSCGRVTLERLKILQGALWASLSHFASAIPPSASFSLVYPLTPLCTSSIHTDTQPRRQRGEASFPLGREVPSLVLQDLNEESDLYLIFFPSFSWTGVLEFSVGPLGFLRGSTFYSACWKCRFCLMEGGSTDSTLSMS